MAEADRTKKRHKEELQKQKDDLLRESQATESDLRSSLDQSMEALKLSTEKEKNQAKEIDKLLLTGLQNAFRVDNSVHWCGSSLNNGETVSTFSASRRCAPSSSF